MVFDNVIEGKFVNLRPVKEEDAEFILRLRNDPEISKFLPSLDVTVEQQRNWIGKQRLDNDSYYFIMEDKSNNPIGTISVYNIEDNHAESGRFCSIGNPIQNSEASLLHFDFIFNKLKLEYLDSWVYKENKPVLAFDQALGCVWEGEKKDENGIPYLFGKVTKDNFNIKSIKIKNKIDRLKSIQ